MIALLFLLLLAISSFYVTSFVSIALWILYTILVGANILRLFMLTRTELQLLCIKSYSDVSALAMILASGLLLGTAYLFLTAGVGWMSCIIVINTVVGLWEYNTGYKLVNKQEVE